MYQNFEHRAVQQMTQKQSFSSQITPLAAQSRNPNLISYIDQVLSKSQNKGFLSPQLSYHGQGQLYPSSLHGSQDSRVPSSQNNRFQSLNGQLFRGCLQENPLTLLSNNSQILNPTTNMADNILTQNHEFHQSLADDKFHTKSSVKYQDNLIKNHQYSQSLNASNINTCDGIMIQKNIQQHNAINQRQNYTQTQKRQPIKQLCIPTQVPIQRPQIDETTKNELDQTVQQSQNYQSKGTSKFQLEIKQIDDKISQITDTKSYLQQSINKNIPSLTERSTQMTFDPSKEQTQTDSIKYEGSINQSPQRSVNQQKSTSLFKTTSIQKSINESPLRIRNQGLHKDDQSSEQPYRSRNLHLTIIKNEEPYNQQRSMIQESPSYTERLTNQHQYQARDNCLPTEMKQLSLHMTMSSEIEQSGNQKLSQEVEQQYQRSLYKDLPTQIVQTTRTPYRAREQRRFTKNEVTTNLPHQASIKQDQLSKNQSMPPKIEVSTFMSPQQSKNVESPFQIDGTIYHSHQRFDSKYLLSKTDVSTNQSLQQSMNQGLVCHTQSSNNESPQRPVQQQPTRSNFQVNKYDSQVQKNYKQAKSIYGPNSQILPFDSKESIQQQSISQNAVLIQSIIQPGNSIEVDKQTLILTEVSHEDKPSKQQPQTSRPIQDQTAKYKIRVKNSEQLVLAQEFDEKPSLSPIKKLTIKPPLQIPNPNIIKQSNTKYPGYEILKFLGKGKFSEVFLARYKLANFQVALKVISKKTIIEMEMQTQLAWEIKVQLVLSHPNIVKLYNFFQNETDVILVIEHCGDGELYEKMKSQKDKRFKESDAVKHVKQVNSALAHLHFNDVIHRDIKPENILLSFGEIKLADFSFCIYSPSQTRQTQCGTMVYSSPELVTGLEYDRSSDMWSLGVLAYELCVGQTPWEHKTKDEAIKMITTAEIDTPEYFSEKLKNYVKALTKKIPKERLNARQAINHPWLTQVRTDQSVFINEEVLK